MRTEYISYPNQINKVTEADLIIALERINKKNLEIRKSFLHPNDAKVQCHKHIHF